MVEPLTNVEKEEDYEVRIHISTFTHNHENIGEINPLGDAITNVQKPHEEAKITSESTQSYTPVREYAITRENINQIIDELFKARQKRKSMVKGKGRYTQPDRK